MMTSVEVFILLHMISLFQKFHDLDIATEIFSLKLRSEESADQLEEAKL